MAKTITSDTELDEALDAYVETQIQQEAQLALIKAYASANGITEHETEKARLETVTKDATVGRIPGWTEGERVAALREAGLEAYVTDTCDTKLLKKDYSRSAAKREKLKEFGFQFKSGSKSLVIKAL